MILLTCSNWQLQIPSRWLAGKVMLLLPFRLPHALHSSENPEKTRQQPSRTSTSEVMHSFLLCKYQLVSLSLLFFQSLGTLSPYSQVSPPHCPNPQEKDWNQLRPVNLCHFLLSLRHVRPRSLPLVCLLRTTTAWTWSRGAAPVQATLTRPRTAARACLPSCRALRSTTVTLVSQLAVTSAEIAILYLTTKRDWGVWWQFFTVHFEVQQEWKHFCLFHSFFIWALVLLKENSNIQRKYLLRPQMLNVAMVD